MKKIIIFLFLFSLPKVFCGGGDEIRIVNLGKVVNTPSIEYAPVISPDGLMLYFVSTRPGSILDAKGNPSHDFWGTTKKDKYSTNFNSPFNLDTSNTQNSLNTRFNEGTASFSPDGKIIYFTACNRTDGRGGCDIYQSTWTVDGWTTPKNLGKGVNSNAWETQPSISPDGNRLYFVSDREGPNGFNNVDIWYSDWDPVEEEWQEAINLKQINTSGKEVSPFISADNVTLFFSSDGYSPNLGGLDFYVTRFDPQFLSWSKPAHLDAPLNTDQDDQFLSINVSGDIIYFASQRKDLPDYCGNLDLYMAFVPSFFHAIILKVSVNDEFTGESINSTVTVLNPVTGRKVEEKINKSKKDVQMIISKSDFGNPKDSLKFVDLQILAENEKKEVTQKTIRVKNPEQQDPDDLREWSDKLGITLEFAKPKQDGDKERTESEFTILTADAQVIGFDGQKEFSLDTLKIEQNSSISMHPLLNYVFFDNNSAEISYRYVKFNDEYKDQFELKTLHNKDIMEIYSHILNIVGLRLNENKKASITLTGCNSNTGEESNNFKLSESRALSIKNYLTSVWKIEKERIIINTRNLPDKFSNNDSNEGMSENRRVEITSDNPKILDHIYTYDTVLSYSPKIIRFKKPIKVKFGEAYWKITMRQGSDIVKEYNGDGKKIQDLDWNLVTEKPNLKLYETMYSEIELNDKVVQTTIISKDTIPVKYISLVEKEKQTKKMKKIEKFSLILFDFGSNKLSKDNEAIINLVRSKIKKNSIVQVYGYTDNIGNDQYNMKLSQNRAKSVSNLLSHKNAIVNGFGESNLLYNNDFPEGRFYCRTVDIIIENIIE